MFDVGVARVDGHLAFDALFQFSPFHFIIQISAAYIAEGLRDRAVRHPPGVRARGPVALSRARQRLDSASSSSTCRRTSTSRGAMRRTPRCRRLPVMGFIRGELDKAGELESGTATAEPAVGLVAQAAGGRERARPSPSRLAAREPARRSARAQDRQGRQPEAVGCERVHAHADRQACARVGGADEQFAKAQYPRHERRRQAVAARVRSAARRRAAVVGQSSSSARRKMVEAARALRADHHRHATTCVSAAASRPSR